MKHRRAHRSRARRRRRATVEGGRRRGSIRDDVNNDISPDPQTNTFSHVFASRDSNRLITYRYGPIFIGSSRVGGSPTRQPIVGLAEVLSRSGRLSCTVIIGQDEFRRNYKWR